MTFYKLDEVPVSRDDKVFKESSAINAVAAFILFGLAAGSLYLGIIKWQPSEGHMALYAPYFFAAILALIGLLPFSYFRACLKPSNWLLRCQLSGLVIKYRSFENWKLPANTLQAVGFDYGEIAWAKLIKEHRIEPSEGKAGTQTSFLTFLALGLANPDTTEFEARLQAERNFRPEGPMITLDYPVQTKPGGIVEIHWTVGIRPSAQKALDMLGQRVKVLEKEHRKVDLTHRPGANRDDEKAKILLLAQSGDEMAAVKLAQQTYGYTLTQAHEFVDGLTGQKDD